LALACEICGNGMRKVLGILLAAVFLPGLEANAMSGGETACAAGGCVVSTDFRPVPSSSSLLHQVNVFAENPGLLVDPRHPQPQTGAGKIYAPIGEIAADNPVPLNARASRTGRTRGTAFLIAPCLVLTNYHAVFGERMSEPTPAEIQRHGATFLIAGRAAAHAMVVVVGKYYDDRNQDYTLLRLETCWGADPDIGWLQLGPLPPGGKPYPVSMAGHPGDLDRDELWIHDKCLLFANRNSFARLTNCANTRGSSGSPIMFNDNGALKVAALIRSERNRTDGVLPAYDESHANVAVDIYRILRHDPAVAKAIAENVLKFYQSVTKDESVPEDLRFCGRANLSVSDVLRCAAAVNTLSTKARAGTAANDPILPDDELRSVWLPAKR
jgi:Trypsin-like peptidase domain